MNIFEEAEQSLKNHTENHLKLVYRKEIWLTGGKVILDSNNMAIKNPGYEFRTLLSISCCKKVIHIWESYFPNSDIAPTALNLAEEYLITQKNYSDIKAKANSLAAGLENTQNLTNEELNALLVGHACVDALYTALSDCYCDDIDDLDEELDSWDASMYAAGAFSGGFPWQDKPYKSNPTALGEFWTWYLSEAFKLKEEIL